MRRHRYRRNTPFVLYCDQNRSLLLVIEISCRLPIFFIQLKMMNMMTMKSVQMKIYIMKASLMLVYSSDFPNKMLNWHYRSRDESLIAFSNYHFYNNRLITFPNPNLESHATGLKLVYVPDGVYKRGAG